MSYIKNNFRLNNSKKRKKNRKTMNLKNQVMRSKEKKWIFYIHRSNVHLYINLIDICNGEVLCQSNSIKYKKDKIITFKYDAIPHMIDEIFHKIINLVGVIHPKNMLFNFSYYKYQGAVKKIIETLVGKMREKIIT